MTLADEAASFVRPSGTQCVVGQLSEQDPELGAEIAEALALGLPGKAIARALKARGHDLGYYSLNRHRRRDCKCPS